MSIKSSKGPPRQRITPTPQVLSRSDAQELGFDTFFTGKPCRNSHRAERLVSSGRCVACRNDAYDRSRPKRESPEGRAANRKKVLKHKRGFSEDEAPPPLVDGHCDLCCKLTEKFHWDHDHVLEELGFPPLETHRGWLCAGCNTSLGKLGDTPDGLIRAYKYVRGLLSR